MTGVPAGRRARLRVMTQPEKYGDVWGQVYDELFSQVDINAVHLLEELSGPQRRMLELGVGTVVALTLVTSVAAQLGDLFESLLKRWAGVKDAGVFLPGHGGVLDRIDSLLFTFPVSYLFVTMLVVPYAT